MLSLGIGYVVAGRVLAPVSRITARARELGEWAPDLSGRIDLGGPDDELRELADTLDSFLDRAEEAVTSQRRFLADAAHELRTPVAAAKTNLDVVLDDSDADLAEHRRAEGVAQRQLARMGRLISDLLVLERRAGARVEVVDLQVAAGSAASELAALAEEREVALVVRPGPRAPVRADRDDLARVLGNLIENAIVHNPPGTSVTVHVRPRDGRVVAEVTDDGLGIPQEARERVFERFQRLGDRRAGTGLGLAIARELARAAGGDVRLGTESGRGSTLTLDLPAA